MTDYIDREAALDEIRDYIEEYSWHTDEHGFHSPEWCSMKEAEMVLTDIPAADVRPVVLCRDCKHSEPWYADKSRCFLWHESGIDVFNDGFCNYGEEMEER